MTRRSDLTGQFARISSGDPWYGPSISAVLSGVTAAQAASRVTPEAHSIWELVLHMTAWVREVRRRLAEGDWGMPAEGDWPAVPEVNEANWQRSVAALAGAHDDLRAALAVFPDDRLDTPLGGSRDPAMGSGQTYAEMLYGLLQHDAYHLGQVSLLKRSLGKR
jgi:uncharacterized damage-inducible protein DinB